MKKIKVLHFELDSHLGGIESFLLNLYTAIDRDSVQFEFVTAVENPALREQFENLGGVIHYVSPHSRPLSYQKDIYKLLQSGFDVVHIHKNSAANIVPLSEAKKVGIPKIIVHSHNTSPSIGGVSSFLHRINQKKLVDISNYRFACSTKAGKWLYGNADFKTIHNGILTEKFLFSEETYLSERKKLGVDSNQILIGNIGRFTEQKNHVFLLDIVNEIIKIDDSFRLVLVGEGELKKEVEKKAEALKLGNKVIFTGLRNDIPQLMKAMDILLMPSLYEGLPIVAVEAQAAGLPLFLSDTVSSETELTDGVSWFSLNQSAKKTAEWIVSESAKANAKKRRERNTQIVDRGYDINTTAAYILDCYKE